MTSFSADIFVAVPPLNRILMHLLDCKAQNYAWGKSGTESVVAQLLQGNVDPKLPYAELWMGTHPNGPSTAVLADGSRQTLEEHIGHPLEYLFKVLSVNTALSIQAHPDLELAKTLHQKFPKVYKDANHKPEMAVALTPFEAMCGFRPAEEISNYLSSVPELRTLVGEETSSAFEEAVKSNKDNSVEFMKPFIRDVFIKLVTADKQKAKEQIEALVLRLSSSPSKSSHLVPETLVLRLSQQYPGDVGAFCPFLLNLFTLQPGQALFLGPNLPHAYLSGNCMECMACSDNVVRAGLTPKFVDVDTLCSMLTYECEKPSVLHGEDVNGVRVYKPPVNAFCLFKYEFKGASKYSVKSVEGDSIAIVMEGSALAVDDSGVSVELVKGSVLFIAKDENVNFNCASELVMFRCSPNTN